MVDIARVGIQVDSSQLQQGEAALEGLAQEGREAAQALSGVQAAAGAAGQGAARMGAGLRTANAHGQAYTRTSSAAGFATANLAAQFNDIGVMLAAGQSPLLLAVQQGTQVNQVLTQMRATGAPLGRTLVSAFTSIISPMSLLTLGIIAGGAALAQWALNAGDAEDEAVDLDDAMSALRSTTEDATRSVEDMQRQYGDLADQMRDTKQALRELDQETSRIAIPSKFGEKLEEIAGAASLFGRVDIAGLFGTPNRAARRGRGMSAEGTTASYQTSHFQDLLRAYQDINLSERERLETGKELLKVYEMLAHYKDGETASEKALKRLILETNDALIEKVSLDERVVEASKSELKAETETQRLLNRGWKEVMVAEEQRQKNRQSHAAQRLKDIDAEARAEKELLEKGVKEVAAAEEEREENRKRHLRERLEGLDRVNRAETMIGARLQDRIDINRAILIYGRDSVEAKEAEMEVQRRLFELELDRMEITGETRDALIEKYERLAHLESQISQNVPTFNRLNGVVDGIANAWAEWVVRGFQDFKGFADAVLDTFKRMLVEMIAMAARNKIMLSLGMGGGIGAGVLGGAAQAATGGGGLFGGGSPIGSLFSIGKSLFGGQSGSMFGGLTGGIGSALFGSFGPGALSAITANTVSSAMVAGSLGIPSIGSGFAGGLTAAMTPGVGMLNVGGASALAGGGMGATLGAMMPALGIAALGGLLISGLMSKKKLLDSGLALDVRPGELNAQTYQYWKKSSLFRRRRWTEHDDLDDETLGAFRETEKGLREPIEAAAKELGIFGDFLEGWSWKTRISLKGLSEEEREAKVAETFQKIADSYARLGFRAGGVSVELEGAAERFTSLAQALTGVNEVLETLGHTAFKVGIPGARHAEALAGGFGGVEEFGSVAAGYYQNFYTEAERIGHVRENITKTLAELNTGLPKSVGEFRSLVEAQNLTTESGRELYTALMQVSSGFSTVMQFEQRLAEERRRAAEVARQAVEASLGSSVQAAQLASQAASALVFSPRNIYAEASLDGAVSPLDRYRRGAAMAQNAARIAQRRSAAEAARSASEAQAAGVHAAESARLRGRFTSSLSSEQLAIQGRLAAAQSAVEQHNLLSRYGVASPTDGGQLRERVSSAAGQFNSSLTEMQRNLQKGAEKAQDLSNAASAASAAASAAAVNYSRAAESSRDYARFLFEIRHLNLQFDVGAKGAQKFADGIIKMFDNADELSEGLQFYYENFFSRGERRRNLRSDLALDFAFLGVDEPKTRQQFRKLVEAQDLSTESGRKLFAALIDISDEFAAATDGANELNDALETSQNLFQTHAREVFVRSAQSAGDFREAGPINDNDPLVRELIDAINRMDINTQRNLADLLLAQSRSSYEPKVQAVQ